MGDDPEAAVLTQAQRAYLRGEKDYVPSTARQVRNRIRQRVETSLAVDLPLLVDEFDPEYLVENSTADWSTGLREIVAFAVLVAQADGLDPDEVVQQGRKQAKTKRAEIVFQELKERFNDNPRDLTVSELSRLLNAGEISREEYTEVVGDAGGDVRPPIGHVDPDEIAEFDDLATFLRVKMAERQQEQEG